MNPEIKEQWATALESGDYPQGQAYLCSHDQYCCWGVLSDLAEKAGIVTSEESFGTKRYSQPGSDQDTRTRFIDSRYPLKSVLDWAGIEYEEGVLTSFIPVVEKLAGFNDGCTDYGATEYKAPKTFKYIASYIRRYL